MTKKGFIKSEMFAITYKGVDYPCKQLTNANGDTDCVATVALMNALCDCEQRGEEECAIDRQMAYYFKEEDFNRSDDELAEMLHDAGCMIADWEE